MLVQQSTEPTEIVTKEMDRMGKNGGTRRNEGDNEGRSASPGRMRGRGSSRSHRGRNYQHRSGSYERTPSHHHSTPYTQHSRQRNRQSVGDQVPATMSIGTRPQETGWKENTKDEPTERWFKITIPHGRNYEKAWLLNSIQRCCSVPFTPVDFHGAGNRALFFVQDESAASALKELSFKIRDRKNRPIRIFVDPCGVPFCIQCMLTPEQMEQLEMVMKKRYSDCQKSLNLQKIRFDPDLLSHRIDMILNRRNCILAVLQIIEKNYPTLLSLNLRSNRLYQLDGLSGIVEKAPEIKILNLCKNELKSVWELKKVAGLKLEELWLKGNPVCQKFLDQSFYVGAILDCFPTLLRLDGWELFPRIAAEIAPPKAVNPFQESCPGFEPIKAEILRFLEQYYLIYDYGDRKGLFGAYRDDAYFSLTVLSTQENPDSDSYCEFFKYSRNLLTLRDPNLRWQLLKFTKHDIMEFFGVLPKTEHNFSSIVVDVWLYMDSMVYFSVHGVFKELEGNFERCVHAFTRTCIASPDSDSCLRLVNDQLFVRNASPEEIQHAFPVPIATSSPDSTSELSEKQQKIVKAFSIQSGMNLTWSQKCLEDNQWDYSRAASIFTVLQNQGMIPQEAFKKMG